MTQKSQEKKNKEPRKSIGVRKEEIVRSIKATEKFITIRDTGELLYFNPSDGQWYDGTTYAEEFTRDRAGVDYSTSLFREVRETLKVDTYTDGKSFISPPEWVNLRNGALNVLTSEFIPRDPEPKYDEEKKKIDDLKEEREKDEGKIKATTADDYQYAMDKLDRKYDPLIKEIRETIKRKKAQWQKSQTEKFAGFYFTSTIPIRYDPTATCPKIDAFYHQIQEGDDNVKRLYELTGYLLYKAYPLKKIFILYGPHDTGKTTLATELWQKHFLGSDAVSSLSIQSIQDDKFDRIKLKGKHANISPELPENTYIKDTSLFKALTGNDMISARLMHSQKEVKFVNFAKIIFLTNHIPMTSEGDDAFFNRVEIFEFFHEFKDGVDANANIIKEIATESELSGLLNESVRALQELLKRMTFTASRSVKEKKDYYLIKSNPFRYYIDNVLGFNNGIEQIDDPDGNLVRAYKQDVYANFVLFCKRYNITGWTEDRFFKSMKKYATDNHIVERRDLKSGWYYSGVYIRSLFTDTENSGSDFDIDDL